MSLSDHIQQLKKIVGNAHVITNDKEKESYETPWRGDKGKAAFVLRPHNTDEVSACVAYLVQHKIPFIPQSGNTGLVGASTPDQTGTQVIINLERLNHIQDINKINRSAHVGAGIRLSKLNMAAEKDHLFFPIDLSADPCLGGMIATNTGGSRLLKYGGVRENLLGLKAVLRDENGTILDLINPLHKNNTGFDTKQRFIGTGGVNGIITECVVSLSSLPQQQATAILIPKNLHAVPNILVVLEKIFGDNLSAFEGISGNAIKAAFDHNPDLKNGFGNNIPDYACLIELNRAWTKRDYETSLEETLQIELQNVMEENNDLLSDVLFGNGNDHWALRHSISEGVQQSGKLVSFDVSFTRDKAINFLIEMQNALPQQFTDIIICDFGHIGDGAMHFNLVINPDDNRLENPDFIPSLREWVLDRVVYDFNGSFSAEHGIGPLNQVAYDKYKL